MYNVAAVTLSSILWFDNNFMFDMNDLIYELSEYVNNIRVSCDCVLGVDIYGSRTWACTGVSIN